VTSAQRVGAAGVESSYLDGLAAQIHQTLLKAVPRLDPLQSNDIGDDERKEVIELVDGVLADFRDSQQIEATVDIGPFRERVLREAARVGPARRPDARRHVREIQVVGTNPLHVIRDSGDHERLELRFTGDGALRRVIQRMTRKRGLWSDSSHVLEGIVDHGFYLYALIPRTPRASWCSASGACAPTPTTSPRWCRRGCSAPTCASCWCWCSRPAAAW
jgi:hypothetical protein